MTLSPRTGSTLTEVLVSLMIMSIGIVSLATMFPLSVLRSIKASQLTNATDLRYNVESLLEMHGEMITFAIAASDNTFPGSKAVVIDPIGYFELTQPVNAANIAYVGLELPGNITNTAAAPYTLMRHHGGLDRNSNPNDGVPAPYTQVQDVKWQAHKLASLPDHWNLQFEMDLTGTPLASGLAGATELTVPPQYNFSTSGFTLPATSGSTVPPSDIGRARIVFFNPDGIAAEVRTIASYDGANLLRWTEDTDNSNSFTGSEVDLNQNGFPDKFPLPTPFNVGKVRIETMEERYSWQLTVRKPVDPLLDRTADIDVVIYFRRKFEDEALEGEQIYKAKFLKGVKTVTVTPDWTNNQPKPFIKPGNYVLDADNARWYRITGVQEPTTGTYTVLIDVPAVADSQKIPGPGNNYNGKAMFPRSVVDVYPIGRKPYP